MDDHNPPQIPSLNLPHDPTHGISPSPEIAAPPAPVANDPPVRWSELAALVAIVLLADSAIYRGVGYAGWSAVIAATPALLFFGAARRRTSRDLIVLGAMLLLLAARLVWCGSPEACVVGVALLPLFAMALAGARPYLLEGVSFTASLALGRGVASFVRSLLQYGRRFAPFGAIAIMLPVVVGIAFSFLFVLANPDLVESVSRTLSRAFEKINKWLSELSVGEMAFICGTAWIAIDLLRPHIRTTNGTASHGQTSAAELNESVGPAPQPLYLAWRNTLVVVIALYAIYLAFEMWTLWFRVFPKGFYYSGYAHEGAAWLTVALALATSILSLIFRGRILRHPRVAGLRWLASAWSLENLLLALAVYNRLFIYINFNGMTRMRVVGLYGVTAVLVGFGLVLIKIVRGHNFAWLLQRHLWTLGLAIFYYVITPTDDWTMRYNVRQILAGNLAPSVQITEHPISDEGLLVLQPLLDCSDEIIRNGVAALLDERRLTLRYTGSQKHHWTAYQFSTSRLAAQLGAYSATPPTFSNPNQRAEAWARFRSYAYQWY